MSSVAANGHIYLFPGIQVMFRSVGGISRAALPPQGPRRAANNTGKVLVVDGGRL
jgi:hypothetical protein